MSFNRRNIIKFTIAIAIAIATALGILTACSPVKTTVSASTKSVVDAFKFLPVDVAYKALRAYLKRNDKNLDKLAKYAKQMRKPLENILAVLLSDE